MTDTQEKIQAKKSAKQAEQQTKQDRLALALRENLKRRKQQSRARQDQDDEVGE